MVALREIRISMERKLYRQQTRYFLSTNAKANIEKQETSRKYDNLTTDTTVGYDFSSSKLWARVKSSAPLCRSCDRSGGRHTWQFYAVSRATERKKGA